MKRDYIEFPSNQLSPARKLHQTLTQQAAKAVFDQPKSTRSFSSAVLRFRKTDIEEVHEFIAKFRREFCQKFENGTDHDSVYSLNMNFFRLDQE